MINGEHTSVDENSLLVKNMHMHDSVSEETKRIFLTYLIAGPAFEAVGVKLVDMENMNGALDAEVMELASHFKE